MKDQVRFVIPVAPAPASGAASALRALDRTGFRLGLLDNHKGNADHLLRMLQERLSVALPVTTVRSYRKPTAVLAAPDELLDQMAREADCVISAMAD